MSHNYDWRRIEVIDERMAAIYRNMPTEQKGLMTAEAHDLIREMLQVRFQQDHPDWTPEQVHREVARSLLGEAARLLETSR